MASILIVDDSALMRKMIRTFIGRVSTHTVVADAASATEALELYRRHHPDLVSMDISMPGQDGLHALQAIRAEFPDAKVIMVSSANEEDLVLEAMARGAAYYILKPINPAKIRKMLERAFGGEGLLPGNEGTEV